MNTAAFISKTIAPRALAPATRCQRPRVGIRSFLTLAAITFVAFMFTATGYGQCVSYIGNEYTSLSANTAIGDSPLFEIQTWPQSSGETVQLEVDYGNNGGYDIYPNLPWVGTSGNNNKWNAYVQMTQSGTHARRYRWFKSGCSDMLAGPYTFTILALVEPSGQSATAVSSAQINLAWTKGTTGGSAKDTLILRSASSTFTDPTQGTGYSVGNTINGATVIYKSNGTSTGDAGLSANTIYYYKFYAENFSYYSAGVTANKYHPAERGHDAGRDRGQYEPVEPDHDRPGQFDLRQFGRDL